MRTLYILAGLMLASLLLPAQNKIRGYEYWFNNAFDGKVRQSLSGSPVLTLETQIPTDALIPGLHSLHYRLYDDSSRYSLTQDHFFYKIPPAVSAGQLVAYEYWFDQGLSTHTTVATASQAVVELNTQLNAETLLPGLHQVHIRFKDNHGLWSLPYSSPFYRMPAVGPTQRNIKGYQYWFDDQYSNNVTQLIAQSPVTTITLSENTLHLPAGLHTLHVRVQDDGGFWSLPHTSHFYRMPQQSVTGHSIVQAHYWFDNNLAAGVMHPVTGQAVAEVNIAADAAALPEGLHWFNIRFRDDAGFWSGTTSQAIYKMPKASTGDNVITAYRYWINENLEQNTTVTLGTPVNPLVAPIQADLSTLEAGKYAIRFQFKDAKGQWSVVTTDSINVQAITAYTFTGNGNWSNPANWSGPVPPSNVPDGKEVVIDHAEGGECIIDIPVTMAPGSRLTVKPGKRLRIQGNLIHQ
ncbi:MAG: hypothetical protein MUF29_06920 [Chitinophagaceae bacterium]|nr:hypothetical protein [Chitinophagaceae bacterium]